MFNLPHLSLMNKTWKNYVDFYFQELIKESKGEVDSLEEVRDRFIYYGKILKNPLIVQPGIHKI